MTQSRTQVQIALLNMAEGADFDTILAKKASIWRDVMYVVTTN